MYIIWLLVFKHLPQHVYMHVTCKYMKACLHNDEFKVYMKALSFTSYWDGSLWGLGLPPIIYTSKTTNWVMHKKIIAIVGVKDQAKQTIRHGVTDLVFNLLLFTVCLMLFCCNTRTCCCWTENIGAVGYNEAGIFRTLRGYDKLTFIQASFPVALTSACDSLCHQE